jgi:hypothetical protein
VTGPHVDGDDDHVCRPVFDEDGELIAVARVGDLDERGEAALRDAIEAVRRRMQEEDTPERRAKAAAALVRNRERLVRLGIRPRDDP